MARAKIEAETGTAAMRAQWAYDELIRRSREGALLASCAELLSWDELTYLPPAGVRHRGEQLAFLARLQHEHATHPRVAELLAAVEGSDLVADPEAPAAVNVRELRRAHDRLTRLPSSLVEETARVSTRAQQEWAAAFASADFPRFRPWLERMVGLKRQEAACLGGGEGPYDALLADYEPGATGREVAALFEALRGELVALAGRIAGSPRRAETGILHRPYPVERQRLFGELAAGVLGFDFGGGRLDATVHPFCSGIGPGDCRITTRYRACDFSGGFFGILHEVGHGLYEQGLLLAHQGTPMGAPPSLGVQESQARLWENLVARSRPFWRYFFPLARQAFHEALAGVGVEEFYFAVNHVGFSLNRVLADEVTYNLHILVRFELERALVSGDLTPADLPGAWEEAYARHLGVRPADDAEGCLQDGHWGSGLVGYFPTYTLGDVFAAQLFARAEGDLGGFEEAFGCGDFSGLLRWLREEVHGQGSRYPAARLIEHATGSPPDHRPLVRYLGRKYGELYGV